MTTPQHLCHAVDCNERIPPARLMCPRHWFKVPMQLRKLVWQTYRPGQEIDKRPSPAYLKAAREAINHVAAMEGKEQLPDSAEITKTLEKLIAEHRKA